MAFTKETSNTPSGGGIRWSLPAGPEVAVAASVNVAGLNGSVTLTGSGAVDSFLGTVAGEFLLVRAAAGSAASFTTAGNIATAVTLVAGEWYFLWNNGGTLHCIGQLPAGDPPFTPYGHILDATMQAAIESLIDDPLDLVNKTEDATPIDTTDWVLEWDASAGVYKKVKPASWGYLKKVGGTMTGPILVADGDALAPPLALSSNPDVGFFGSSANGLMSFSCEGTEAVRFGSAGVVLPSTGKVRFFNGTLLAGSADLNLIRGTTRRLDIQADGVAAATLRIAGNGTTGTEYYSIAPQISYTLVTATGTLVQNVPTTFRHELRVNNVTTLAVTNSAAVPGTTSAVDLGTTLLQFRTAFIGDSIQATRVKALVEANATSFVRISVPAQSSVGGYVEYTIQANDATQFQARTGIVMFSFVNSTVSGKQALLTRPDGGLTVDNTTDCFIGNSGTLTSAFTTDTSGANVIDIRDNSTSSLAQTTLQISYRVVITSGTATVTPL